jgi:aspartyl-tRNA(Asn)/glutamyl-tRNA(Gln) amidotransferase subunit C
MDFDVKKYARLARIRLTHEEEEKFHKDLGEILGHAEELEKINVKNVEPTTGGTPLRSIFRGDVSPKTAGGDFKPGFPDKEGGYLKIPKVFEND